MLKALPSREHIAIYAVGRKLQVICEFTSDRDLLERQLRKWKPDVDTPETRQLSSAFPMPVGNDGLPQLANTRGDAAAEAARIDALERTSSNDEAMEQVADHLAGIPGRKNLIWLSRRFVVNPRALGKFNAANVAIYPVDVDGVCRLCPPPPKEQMRAIASVTGGVPYFERNDLVHRPVSPL
jgi:VWFA-related protein